MPTVYCPLATGFSFCEAFIRTKNSGQRLSLNGYEYNEEGSSPPLLCDNLCPVTVPSFNTVYQRFLSVWVKRYVMAVFNATLCSSLLYNLYER